LEREALPTTLITGAAGNLGTLLAEHLLTGGHELRLMHHRRPRADLLAHLEYPTLDEGLATLQ
jgi:uncharacterized protein YbjT (DUF2867 family)